MNVFICQEIMGQTANLTPEESLHCYRVLRKKAGETIELIDGKGFFLRGKIEKIDKNHCKVHIEDRWEDVPTGYYLHLGVAPTKNISRFEWFVEKAVEIGVDEITPLLCKRSERTKVPMERLEKIIQSAAKQSLRARFPRLNPPTPIDSITSSGQPGQKLVAHLTPNASHLMQVAVPEGAYALLIGPEGDFSPEELKALEQFDWTPVVLGNKRLRTETAGVVATQIINGIHFKQ